MRGAIAKKASMLVITGAVAMGLLSGCFGGDEKPSVTPTAVSGAMPAASPIVSTSASVTAIATTAPQATEGAAQPTTPAEPPTTKATKSRPVLALSANNSGDMELYAGWPLLIEGTLMHPDLMRGDIAVEGITAGSNGRPWTSALALQVADEKGAAQQWPLHIEGAPGGAVTLDRDVASTAYWWLSPDETAKLAEGTYTVSAALDTEGAEGVRAVPVVIKITRAPAKLTPEQESLNAQMLAALALVRGDKAGAAAALDKLLAAQPDNIAALEFKGDLLAEDGKYAEALAAYNKAVELFYKQQPNAEEPPALLIQKQHAMADKLLEKE